MENKEWGWRDKWAFPKQDKEFTIKIKISKNTMGLINNIKNEFKIIFNSIKEDGVII